MTINHTTTNQTRAHREQPMSRQHELRIIEGDCLAVMPTLEAASVDAVVCDPPYGFSFMGKAWDHSVPGAPFWTEALRVSKPGSYLLAFGGTRTFHRLTCAIEDAGWEIRDCLSWLYGSGFPKSLDVSKAIDKAAGAEREIISTRKGQGSIPNDRGKWGLQPNTPVEITAPSTDAARQWQGWGTALKPAWEPIILARKPFKSTVAANVQEHGTGALNIDACRIEGGSRPPTISPPKNGALPGEFRQGGIACGVTTSGRWPANVVLDEEAAGLLDEQTAGTRASKPSATGGGFVATGAFPIRNDVPTTYGDSGGASRFFYTAKASRAEREAGLEGMEPRLVQTGCAGDMPTDDDGNPRDRFKKVAANHHPTVKPLALMQWLCRLVTPEGRVNPRSLLRKRHHGQGSRSRGLFIHRHREEP